MLVCERVVRLTEEKEYETIFWPRPCWRFPPGFPLPRRRAELRAEPPRPRPRPALIRELTPPPPAARTRTRPRIAHLASRPAARRRPPLVSRTRTPRLPPRPNEKDHRRLLIDNVRQGEGRRRPVGGVGVDCLMGAGLADWGPPLDSIKFGDSSNSVIAECEEAVDDAQSLHHHRLAQSHRFYLPGFLTRPVAGRPFL